MKTGHTQKNNCPDCPGLKDTRAKRCIKCHGKNNGFTGVASTAGKRGAAMTWGSHKEVIASTYRRKTNHGYVDIKVPNWPSSVNGWVREHRYMMERHLGRFLTAEETVHHKNGIKTDNNITNLELWTIAQPTGQRVEDLLEWAYTIIERYGDELSVDLRAGG